MDDHGNGNIHFRISRGDILKQGTGVTKEAILVSIARNIIKSFCCQVNKQNGKLNDSLILASAGLNTSRSQDRVQAHSQWFGIVFAGNSKNLLTVALAAESVPDRELPTAIMALNYRPQDCIHLRPLFKHYRNTQWQVSSYCVPRSRRQNTVRSLVGVGV